MSPLQQLPTNKRPRTTIACGDGPDMQCRSTNRPCAETIRQVQQEVAPVSSRMLESRSAERSPPSRTLAKLYKLLQVLPKERRRDILTNSLSECQRRALEIWLLTEKKTCPSSPAKSQKQDLLKTSAVKASTAKAKTKEISGLVRNSQRNGTYYSAQVGVGNLKLISRADRDPRLALRVHAALLCIRKRVLESSNVPDDLSNRWSDFEVIFRAAVAEVLQQHELDASHIGLRFFVSVKPLWASRALCTRPYSVATEMDLGMSAWRHLNEAKASVGQRSHVLRATSPAELQKEWQLLRDAYAQVMTKAGYCQDRLASRLAALEAEQQVKLEAQMELWNRTRMAAEEHRQRLASEQLAREDAKQLRAASSEGSAEAAIQKLLRRIAYLAA